MPANQAPAPHSKLLLAASLVALPCLAFYAVLLHFAVNIPIFDDYDAGLDFLNHSVQIPTLPGRLSYLLAAQQNEYKIVFGHTIVWLQYALLGSLNLKLTCALGNLFILALGIVLWKMFLPAEPDLARRLALFAPVVLLVFQLNYVETLDWALPCLQNTGSVFFAFASLYKLNRPGRTSFVLALLLLMLSIAASGNGFFLFPIGLLMLLMERRYIQSLLWLTTTLLCIAGYAFHFNTQSSQSAAHHSILQTILHLRPIFFLGFIGNAVFYPKITSYVFGFILLLYLAYLIHIGRWKRNRLVSYCVLFLLFTAAGVTGIRSELGFGQATVSRYRIYGDLLLALLWFSFAEETLQRRRSGLRRTPSYVAGLAAACLFCLGNDIFGIHSLIQRDHDLIQGMALYEHPQPAQPPGPIMPLADLPHAYDGYNLHARNVLAESERMRIYHPPAF